MPRATLLDFFEDYSASDDVFVVHDDGYRTRQWTYREVGVAARAFAAELAAAGVARGDKIVIWSENRAEWVIAFWGVLLAGAVIVPVDFRASVDLLARVAKIVAAKIVLVGEEVEVPQQITGTVWKLAQGSGLRAQNGRTRTAELPNPRTV